MFEGPLPSSCAILNKLHMTFSPGCFRITKCRYGKHFVQPVVGPTPSIETSPGWCHASCSTERWTWQQLEACRSMKIYYIEWHAVSCHRQVTKCHKRLCNVTLRVAWSMGKSVIDILHIGNKISKKSIRNPQFTPAVPRHSVDGLLRASSRTFLKPCSPFTCLASKDSEHWKTHGNAVCLLIMDFFSKSKTLKDKKCNELYWTQHFI